MESFSGGIEESTEDNQGHKKSKLKSIKTRLFRRSKIAGEEVNTKLSQSASDIAAGQALGSDEDLLCSQAVMGSRAFSHDSIFLADELLTDAEPVRVLSQENVQSNIKALQLKLQKQNLRFGPPPLVLPTRRREDPGSRSEDGGLPHSPSEISAGDTIQAALSKIITRPSSGPLSPILKPATTQSVPSAPSSTLPLSVASIPSPLDFSSPVQFTPCLDTSAARHRMSVKPRNQRTSTKKRLTALDSRSHLDTLNNIHHPEAVEDEEKGFSETEEAVLEKEQGANISITSLPSKYPQLESLTSVAAPSLTLSQQDPALPGRVSSISSQVLRVKPHRHGDLMSSERPHSFFIQSELQKNRDDAEDFESQIKSNDERNTLNKAGTADTNSPLSTTFGSVVGSRPTSVHQQVQGETENLRGIKRPTPGSGSFHFSITSIKNRVGERPRSGSFVEVLEQCRAGCKTGGEAEERRGLQPRGGTITGRQEDKRTVIPWDKWDSLKKVESMTTSKTLTTDKGPLDGAEVESSSHEVVDEAVEAKEEVQEEEGRTKFGFKLRPTSQSMRFWSDAPSRHPSNPPLYQDQCDRQKTQEVQDNTVSKKLPTNTPSNSGDVRLADPTPAGFNLPGKHNLPPTWDHQTLPRDVQTTSSYLKEVETALVASKEPQPAPQTTSSEVSWMSLAMEKTRSIQQLFTSRFPRDSTGGQATARPQAQPTNLAETHAGEQIQTLKLQESTTPLQVARQSSADTVVVETVQTQSQGVKSSFVATMAQKTSTMSPSLPNTSKEPEKHISEPKPHTNTTQPVSHTVPQTNLWTTQSPLHSSSQTETTILFGQGTVTQSLAQSYLSSGQQPWSIRGPQPPNPLRNTALTSIFAAASSSAPPSPVTATGREERAAAVLEKESPSPLGKRAVWAGSVSEKAAFLEKRAEWTTPPGTKGVELKKAPSETQSSAESPSSFKRTQNKDIKPEGRQGVKLAESSPTKVPDWLRKNVGSPSSPSSSPPSTLKSMSDGDQPSWMELAKRKSMAWSDRNMD